MIIIEPEIFNQFDEIKCGFSTKIDAETAPPFHFNLSNSVGDDSEQVLARRSKFYSNFGLSIAEVVTQYQVHGDVITFVSQPGNYPSSDALVTATAGLGLVISSADCLPVFLYDKKNSVIAAIHSGWRGSEKRILRKTLDYLTDNFKADPDHLYAYFGPSISPDVYEVGEEVAQRFPKRYRRPHKRKFLLNIPQFNFDFIHAYGVPRENIQISKLCSYSQNNLLHSYRRDGQLSGRAVGLIVMQKN